MRQENGLNYEDHIQRISSLVDARRLADAALAISDAYTEYGASKPYLVYAVDRITKLTDHYEELGDWKHSGKTYEDSLLEVRDGQGKPFPGTAFALHHLAYLKRHLGQDKDAIPLLEELRRLETEEWTLPMGPEQAWGACLVSCYEDTGDTVSAEEVRRNYLRLHGRIGDAEITRRKREYYAEQSRRVKPSSAIRLAKPDLRGHWEQPGAKLNIQSPKPWWKFW